MRDTTLAAGGDDYADAVLFVRPAARGTQMLEDGSSGHDWIVPSAAGPVVPQGWVGGWVSHHDPETGSSAEVVCWDPDRVRTVVASRGPMGRPVQAELAAKGWRRVSLAGRDVWVRPAQGRETDRASLREVGSTGRSVALAERGRS